ncbi:hypothetical protein B0H13DRAFT_2373888 [Mycena leptocephala]|nr:hypothetical protein B0H13DRAFT_2373888 [Mycena leptocephala]
MVGPIIEPVLAPGKRRVRNALSRAPYELLSGVFSTVGAALLYTLDTPAKRDSDDGAAELLQARRRGFDDGCDAHVQLHQRCLLRHSRSIPLCQPPTARTAPTIDAAKVLATGASEIQRVFSGDDLVAVLNAYIVGIKDVFAFSLAGAAFTVLIALAIPFKKLPSHEKMGTEEKEKALVDSDPRDSESTTRVARLVVLALVRKIWEDGAPRERAFLSDPWVSADITELQYLSAQPVVVPPGFTETHPNSPGWWRKPETSWFWYTSPGCFLPLLQDEG